MHRDYLISKFEQAKSLCGTTDKNPVSGVHFEPCLPASVESRAVPSHVHLRTLSCSLMFNHIASTMIYLIVQHPLDPQFPKKKLLEDWRQSSMSMFPIECFRSGHSEAAEDEAPGKAHVRSFLSNAGVVRSSYHSFRYLQTTVTYTIFS